MKPFARRLSAALIAGVVAMLFAGGAQAVLLADGDGTRNLALPPEVPGLRRVVDRSGFGAVFLENGWVITAAHVSAGKLQIAGESFEPQPGTLREFPNPDGSRADLLLFRVDPGAGVGLLPMSPLEIATRPPPPGALVYLMGSGSNRGDPLRWSMGALGERKGWKWGGGNALRWGTNRVSGSKAMVTMGTYRSRIFSMVFGQPGGANTTEHEAMVAIGDSGGGVFSQQDGRWVLSGVLVARTTHPGQPDDTAAYGNRILAVDLSHYRERILAVLEEEPSPALVPPSNGGGGEGTIPRLVPPEVAPPSPSANLSP